jgi:cyclophilin family peptidyl-prolyl cis-trans isomerase
MAWINCPHCHSPNSDADGTCHKCGAALTVTVPPTPLPPPGLPYPPPVGTAGAGVGLGEPSLVPTVLITVFFGLFGLIPALLHSKMARERGYSGRPYWWAFGLIVGGEALLGLVLAIVLAVTVPTVVHANSPTPFSGPGSTVPSSPAPAGGSGNTSPSAITTSANCPSNLAATLNKPSYPSSPPMTIDPTKTYTATVTTDIGPFTIRLHPRTTPTAVNSFVFLAERHFFDCIVFHRVIQNFVDQTGDPTGTGTGGPGYTFADELPPVASPQYPLGSVAMANSGPNTNGSQFFIVAGPVGESLPPSYSLFGTVTSGMGVVEKINADGASSSNSAGTPTVMHRMISGRSLSRRPRDQIRAEATVPG